MEHLVCVLFGICFVQMLLATKISQISLNNLALGLINCGKLMAVYSWREPVEKEEK